MVVKVEEHQFQDPVNYREFNITVDSPESEFTLTTTLTSDPSTVDQWIRRNLAHRVDPNDDSGIIGLGIQWNLQDPDDKAAAATIQLCVRQYCLIFHVCRAEYSPQSLRELLRNDNYTFVSLYSAYYAAKMAHIDYPRNVRPHSLSMLPEMPIDLRMHVLDNQGQPYLKFWAVKAIVREVLGLEVAYDDEDAVIYSDWRVRNLTVEQVGYASVNAFVSYHIGVRLRAWELNPHLGATI